MLSPNSSAPRTRNAAATRQAMLEAARHQFARESYENVGLREIARAVGVDPALICRYFGSKEALFREALRHPGDDNFLDGVTAETLCGYFADLLMETESDDAAEKGEWLLMVLRSAGSPQASVMVRDSLNEAVLEPVAALLGGSDADQRAGLLMSVLMGIAVMRTIMGVECLSDGNDARMRGKFVELLSAAMR